MEFSKIGDLTKFAKEIEDVFKKHFHCRPAMSIAFSLPPDFNEGHWVTNVSRDKGIKLFQETANKMRAQIN